MKHNRKVSKDLRKIKETLEDALRELEVLEIEVAKVNIIKAINIITASLWEEENRTRK